MSASATSVGLCSTCNNVPECFHHARRGPALFCEMFDNFVSPGTMVASPPASLRTAALPTWAEAGLCMNCEHQQRCGHPRPEGGIWHCEDYE